MSEHSMIEERPLPDITDVAAPFWEATRRHELVVQYCAACNTAQFPPEISCTECGAPDLTWRPVSGRARLYSWTVAHPPLLPYFAARAPWPVVAVELEEGPRMVSRLIDVPIDDYAFDLPLEVAFEDIDEEISLVVFKRAGG